VVKDFHFSSLHNPIQPLILGVDPDQFSWILVRMAPDDVAGTLSFLENRWGELRPGERFAPRFFDDMLGREYRVEQRAGKLVLAFTIVTAFVAVLGLFGLAAYSAGRRAKEIGVRRVLGSSVSGIVGLLTREVVFLVLLAALVAAPLGYLAADSWLQGFAYRIDIGPGRFLLTAAAVLIAALLTVTYQAVRAARANPVDVLNCE
jgi:putative ABC transport system permease protein